MHDGCMLERSLVRCLRVTLYAQLDRLGWLGLFFVQTARKTGSRILVYSRWNKEATSTRKKTRVRANCEANFSWFVSQKKKWKGKVNAACVRSDRPLQWCVKLATHDEVRWSGKVIMMRRNTSRLTDDFCACSTRSCSYERLIATSARSCAKKNEKSLSLDI